jgi:hypothetical protein
MDMAHICRTCGTDTREGVHNRVRMQDEDSVVFECVVPRESMLPRLVTFVDLSGCGAPEYWYRQPPDIGADVPGGGAV